MTDKLWLLLGITIDRLLLAILIVLLVTLPSIVDQELYNSVQTAKFIGFSYAILVLATVSAGQMLRPGTVFNITASDLILLLLVVYLSINRYFLQPHNAFSIGYYEMIGLSVLYAIIRQQPRSHHFLLLIATLLGGLAQVGTGFRQLLGFVPSYNINFKVTGAYFNPGPYSGLLASVFIIGIGLYLYRYRLVAFFIRSRIVARRFRLAASNILQVFFITLLGTSLFILIAVRSRGAILAVLAGSMYIFFIQHGGYAWIRKKISTQHRLFAGIGIFVLIGILAVGAYRLKKNSADGRVLIWKVTGQLIADRPWLGHGFDQFKAVYMRYQAKFFEERPDSSESPLADNTQYAFNELLQFTAENGVVATLLVLTGIGLAFLTGRKKKVRPTLLIAQAGVLGFCLFAIFSYPLQILPIKANLVLCLAIMAAYQPITFSIQISHSTDRSGKAIRMLLTGSILAILCPLYVKTTSIYSAFILYQEAFNLQQHRSLPEAISRYQQASVILQDDGEFLTSYGKALSLANQHEQAIDVLTRAEKYYTSTVTYTTLGDSYKELKQYLQAERCYRMASAMTPGRFYPEYLLAKLYLETGEKNKAVAIANALLQKEVKIESTAVYQIRAEMKALITAP
ncbi:hypothetical protein KK062_17190 [Fulvivirgaceae bacterium PWU5]|uniref:O-antigen ligase-related domain-containing protein n=1 Tax=Dawidia cretensis TaxID=2782350 RepID=A0AAP2E1V6_9BACT|nr:O-antigen ligase family protein [Dawidia cretensis]MBT1709984.1 hypothetical protein [Dawidia cretensis]